MIWRSEWVEIARKKLTMEYFLKFAKFFNWQDRHIGADAVLPLLSKHKDLEVCMNGLYELEKGS